MSGTTHQTGATETDRLFAYAGRVEQYMADDLDRRPLPDNLRDAIRYSLLGPGKRLRPVLVGHACETVGGSLETALPPAAAIEMIHCFSLVHDDLPAMDNDDLRRGRPTLHKKTCDAMAILAGDAMMGLAVQMLANRVEPAQLSRALVRELTAGTGDMIAGQVYDTLPDFGDATSHAERLETIHRLKTGALIRCAVRMGGMVGGADKKQLAALTKYGEAIGLMFQIVDDLLDVTQTTEQLGKTAGKDAVQDKLTYPAVHGIEKSRAMVEELESSALNALKELPNSTGLADLCRFLAVRTR